MCRLHTEEPASHALCRIPRARFLYLHWRRRSRLQARYRDSPQTVWHALDRTRRQCHHRTSLLQAERQIRRFLGAPSPDQGCLDFKNLSCTLRLEPEVPKCCAAIPIWSDTSATSIRPTNCLSVPLRSILCAPTVISPWATFSMRLLATPKPIKIWNVPWS